MSIIQIDDNDANGVEEHHIRKVNVRVIRRGTNKIVEYKKDTVEWCEKCCRSFNSLAYDSCNFCKQLGNDTIISNKTKISNRKLIDQFKLDHPRLLLPEEEYPMWSPLTDEELKECHIKEQKRLELFNKPIDIPDFNMYCS